MTSRQLHVLRIYHSGVVAPWRRRNHELRRQGIEVTLVSPHRWNEGGHDVVARPESDENVRLVHTIGRHPFRFAYEPLGLWRALRSRHFDVIDIHEEPASLATFEVRVLARLAGVDAPYCLYSAENLPKSYPVPFRWFERSALRGAAAVHTCNEEAGELLRSRGFSGRIRNLGLGVEMDHFAPPPASGEPASSADPLRVGYVGRLDERKGVLVLLDALKRVEHASLTYVGAGAAERTLAERISDAGISNRVAIRGFVNHADLPSLYREFDVVVVPSLTTPRWVEQFGRVAVEALACSVAVVASDSGSLPWLVGDAGVVVAQNDVDELAKALALLDEDRALLARLKSAGPGSATRFSWASIAREQAELYRTVLEDAFAPLEDGVGAGR